MNFKLIFIVIFIAFEKWVVCIHPSIVVLRQLLNTFTVYMNLTYNGLANDLNPTLEFNQCYLMSIAVCAEHRTAALLKRWSHSIAEFILLQRISFGIEWMNSINSGEVARRLIETQISMGRSNADNEVCSYFAKSHETANSTTIHPVRQHASHEHNFLNTITSLFCLSSRIRNIYFFHVLCCAVPCWTMACTALGCLFGDTHFFPFRNVVEFYFNIKMHSHRAQAGRKKYRKVSLSESVSHLFNKLIFFYHFRASILTSCVRDLNEK